MVVRLLEIALLYGHFLGALFFSSGTPLPSPTPCASPRHGGTGHLLELLTEHGLTYRLKPAVLASPLFVVLGEPRRWATFC